MEVKKIEIQESKVNKGMFITVLTVEDGAKLVLGGNTNEPGYAVPYERAWDVTTMEEKGYGK